MTVTGDGTRYILKDWFLDRECNIKDGYEIRQALSRLAMLHSQLRKIEFKEEWNMGSILSGPLEEELERHNREMQRARNYIRSKRKKQNLSCASSAAIRCFTTRPWKRYRAYGSCGPAQMNCRRRAPRRIIPGNT